MSSERPYLHVADYVVFAFTLAISASIGIYYRFVGGKQRTANEYFLADGQMGVIPVAFSLMASFMSAVTLLGLSAENYIFGTQFVVINIAYVIATPIVAFVFLPVFFRAGSASAFEYLERRFSKVTRLTASFVYMAQMIMYMSVVLYAPALALSAVTGLGKWTSVLSVGVVCTFYSSIGGIKAVLWTDVFQSILMYAAIITVVVKGTLDVGGLSRVWSLAEAGDRIQFLNIDPNPLVRHTVWSLAIGGVFTYVAIYGVNQTQVQRLLTIGDLKRSQAAVFVTLPIVSALSLSTSLAGIVVYANFYNCDPLLRANVTHVSKADQILPYFVMKSLGSMPGLPGLFVAGIFSGALSTMSSAINSLAAVTFEDFIRPFCFKEASSRKVVTIIKLIAFVYGILCMCLTYVVDQVGGVLEASLKILNTTGGPLLGLFSLGMLCRRAKTKSALGGFIIALAVCVWVTVGAHVSKIVTPKLVQSIDGCPNNVSFGLHNSSYSISHTESSGIWSAVSKGVDSSEYVLPIYKLSYMWYACFGWAIAFFTGLLGSFIPEKSKKVDILLLSPVVTCGSTEVVKNDEEDQSTPMMATHL